MSEQPQVESEALSNIWDDLANTDMNAVETSRPLLAPGTHEFLIKDVKKDESKKGTPCLSIQLQLQGEGQSVDGKTMTGATIFHRIWLVTTEKYDYKQDLARFMDAALGSRTWDPTLEAYKNQTCVCVTGIENSTDPTTGESYPPREQVKRFMKKA